MIRRRRTQIISCGAPLLLSRIVLVLTELNYIPFILKGKICFSMIFNVSVNILFEEWEERGKAGTGA